MSGLFGEIFSLGTKTLVEQAKSELEEVKDGANAIIDAIPKKELMKSLADSDDDTLKLFKGGMKLADGYYGLMEKDTFMLIDIMERLDIITKRLDKIDNKIDRIESKM